MGFAAELIDKSRAQLANVASAFARIGARTQDRKRQPGQTNAEDFRQIIIQKVGKIVHRWIGDRDKRTHKDDQLPPQSGEFWHLQFQQLHGSEQGKQEQQELPQIGYLHHQTEFHRETEQREQPVFALVDSHSFYVVGYFEETKLRHIQEGAPAQITLYSGSTRLQGHVSSIGRAIYDQSVETDSGLVPDIKPNVPWVRLAQRVPVRVEFDKLPADITLVSGTTCTVSIGTR